MKPILDLIYKVGSLNWLIIPLIFITMVLDFVGMSLTYPLFQFLGDRLPEPGEDKLFDMMGTFLHSWNISFSKETIIFWVLLVFFAKAFAVVAYRAVAAKGALRYMVELRARVFSSLFAARYMPDSDDNSRFVNGLNTQSELATGAIYQAFQIIQGLVVLLGAVLLANMLSWQIFLVVSIVGLVLLAPLRATMSYAAGLGVRLANLNRALYKNSEAGVRHRRYLKATQSFHGFARKVSSISSDIRSLQFRFTLMNATTSSASEPLSLVVVTAMFFTGVYFEIPVEMMIVQSIVLYRIFSKAMPLATELQNFRKSYASVEYCEEILSELEGKREKIINSERHFEPFVFPSEIILKEVCFGYESEENLLENISITIPATGLTVLMGPSGSGKTTILNMLAGLLEPDSGTITIGEVEMKEIDLSAYQKRIGLVTQDSPLFGLTIRENLRLRGEGVSDEKIVRLLKHFKLEGIFPHEEIDLDYMVSEDVGNLSGGQRQRLALVREMLCEPDFLLMDEPSSALDEATREIIVETLKEKSQNTSIFLVTHDSRFEEVADSIFRVCHGGVVRSEKILSEKTL